jgi:hypothetical protein
LEFLPAAVGLYEKGLLEEWLDKLYLSGLEGVCVFLSLKNPLSPCEIYPERGLVCRLFGLSFVHDKKGHKELWACRYLKEKFQIFLQGHKGLERGPVASHYGMRLIGIDPELGKGHYPINYAIYKALEMTGFYESYRNAC